MTTAAKKAKAKLIRRPIGVTIMRALLIDEHGAVQQDPVGVLVPSHPIDRRSLRERKFGIGTQLRAELRRDRNPGFWRKAHVLGGWLADHCDEFQGLGMHDAIKKLQELSGIGCDQVEYDIPNVGKLMRTEPESLNFGDMDEGRFNELWSGKDGEGGWIGWLRLNVFGGLDTIDREEVEELIRRPE